MIQHSSEWENCLTSLIHYRVTTALTPPCRWGSYSSFQSHVCIYNLWFEWSYTVLESNAQCFSLVWLSREAKLSLLSCICVSTRIAPPFWQCRIILSCQLSKAKCLRCFQRRLCTRELRTKPVTLCETIKPAYSCKVQIFSLQTSCRTGNKLLAIFILGNFSSAECILRYIAYCCVGTPSVMASVPLWF